jgi:hypothetical protein
MPEAGVLWCSTVKGYSAIFSTGTYRSKYKSQSENVMKYIYIYIYVYIYIYLLLISSIYPIIEKVTTKNENKLRKHNIKNIIYEPLVVMDVLFSLGYYFFGCMFANVVAGLVPIGVTHSFLNNFELNSKKFNKPHKVYQ